MFWTDASRQYHHEAIWIFINYERMRMPTHKKWHGERNVNLSTFYAYGGILQCFQQVVNDKMLHMNLHLVIEFHCQ